jgi:hypothetical protein
MQTQPVLQTRMYTRATFDDPSLAKKLLVHLLGHAQFAPDRFGESEPLKSFFPDLAEEAIQIMAGSDSRSQTVFFERRRAPRCSYSVRWSRMPHVAFGICQASVAQGFVARASRLSEWLQFGMGMADICGAYYASCALHAEAVQKNRLSWRVADPRAKDPTRGVETVSGVGVNLAKGIPGVYWGNYFNRFYVEWFGREKFDDLPCVAKRWMPGGGIFFTTAPTPFEWNTPEAVTLQNAVKRHLGEDAFFDIETVRGLIEILQPIPMSNEPEQYQPPRRVPDFPFRVEAPKLGSIIEQIDDARDYFLGNGFDLLSVEGATLVFRDRKGGTMRVTVGPGGKVEYWPRL